MPQLRPNAVKKLKKYILAECLNEERQPWILKYHVPSSLYTSFPRDGKYSQAQPRTRTCLIILSPVNKGEAY